MTTKVRKELTRRKVMRATRKLKLDEKQDILEDMAGVKPKITINTAELPPGAHVETDRKKPWTYKDMRQFPNVQFLSEETVIITWNGLRYQLLTGAIHDLPLPIQQAYVNHRRALRDAAKSLPTDTGFETEVLLGAGALEPE